MIMFCSSVGVELVVSNVIGERPCCRSTSLYTSIIGMPSQRKNIVFPIEYISDFSILEIGQDVGTLTTPVIVATKSDVSGLNFL